jgi:hypothetical protein
VGESESFQKYIWQDFKTSCGMKMFIEKEIIIGMQRKIFPHP